MNRLIWGSLLTLASATTNAIPPETRSLPLDRISLEHINIQGQIQTWRMHKVCIDGQAYLMIIRAQEEPVAISASYKDGKPEQCQIQSTATNEPEINDRQTDQAGPGDSRATRK